MHKLYGANIDDTATVLLFHLADSRLGDEVRPFQIDMNIPVKIFFGVVQETTEAVIYLATASFTTCVHGDWLLRPAMNITAINGHDYASGETCRCKINHCLCRFLHFTDAIH